MPSEPLPINTWSLADGYLQPENPDPALRLSPSGTPGPPSDDLSLIMAASNLGLAIMAVVPELQVAGGFLTVLYGLISIALTDGNNTSTNAAGDIALKDHVDTMVAKLQGLQDSVTTLQGVNPIPNPDIYKTQLISMNTVLAEALPEFMIASYRRQTAMLFLSAGTIHLSILRKLIDADGESIWIETLRSRANAYSVWLSQTKQAIIDQRAGEISELVASPGWPPYMRNSVQDTRLVNGSTYYIDLAPVVGADSRRAEYINRRLAMFRELPWIKDIDSCIRRWQQTAKLCDRNNPNAFAGVPEGAAFPLEIPDASYWDRVDRVAWTGANKFSILPSLSSPKWQTFAVPVAGMRPVSLVVSGTASSPIFTLHGGCRMVLRPGSTPTLSLSIDDRAVVADKRLSVPRGLPLTEEVTIFPTFADNATSMAFEKLTTSTVTEARYLFTEMKTASNDYELYITSSHSGLRDHWLIRGPNGLASKILTPNRDFIADKIIPTLTKPSVDAVTAAFTSCTEAQCALQTYGPYGASQIYSYVVRFFAITGSLDTRGWWIFEGDGSAGPWRMSRAAPPKDPRPGRGR